MLYCSSRKPVLAIKIPVTRTGQIWSLFVNSRICHKFVEQKHETTYFDIRISSPSCGHVAQLAQAATASWTCNLVVPIASLVGGVILQLWKWRRYAAYQTRTHTLTSVLVTGDWDGRNDRVDNVTCYGETRLFPSANMRGTTYEFISWQLQHRHKFLDPSWSFVVTKFVHERDGISHQFPNVLSSVSMAL